MRDRPCRALSARSSAEMANIAARLSRTSASCSAGRLWQRASSAKARASLLRPAANRDTVRRATSGPRSGCRDGTNERATLAMSAEALGSVIPSESAASARARTAVTSPGSALAANRAATSTGRAPPARRTSAASRSRARRTVSGTALRTASRARSCWKASRPPSSTKIPASITSRTGLTRSVTGMRAMAAI